MTGHASLPGWVCAVARVDAAGLWLTQNAFPFGMLCVMVGGTIGTNAFAVALLAGCFPQIQQEMVVVAQALLVMIGLFDLCLGYVALEIWIDHRYGGCWKAQCFPERPATVPEDLGDDDDWEDGL